MPKLVKMGFGLWRSLKTDISVEIFNDHNTSFIQGSKKFGKHWFNVFSTIITVYTITNTNIPVSLP
ncbi:hypothetical protein O3M35_012354 [Rhynocoris fuscipes]|uniref:Uncharacterized protein n=1 Tax=Rhynocoris fuscipes TaxID=488301 RepID=A0AAW1CTB9_9HEMI